MQESFLLIGKILLVYYFLSAGVKNILHFQQRTGMLEAKKILFPQAALTIGIFLQIVGSLSILFNFFATIGFIFLIIFTLLTNFIICDYWHKEGAERYLTSAIFYANLAIVGSLLIIFFKN